MDLMEAVKRRYSHKQPFSDTAVPLEHLLQISEAGLMAPTGINSQCVHLIILENKNAIAPVLTASASKSLESAPTAIALFTDSVGQTGMKNFEIEDYSAAAENILLAATALGYASVWLDSPYFSEAAQKAVCKALRVPETFSLRVMLPIGIPAEPGIRRPKKPFRERVFLNIYGEKAPE